MELFAKAASTVDEMEEKLRRGAEGIEIQLLTPDDPFFRGGWVDSVGTELAAKVRAVHLPLSGKCGYGNYPVETPEGLAILEETCRVATELMSLTEAEMHVICHYASLKPVLIKMGTYRFIAAYIRKIAEQYRDVHICIENTPFDFLNWDNDNVELAEDIGSPNVGTCLDTCHALITEKMTRVTAHLTGKEPMALERIFRANSETCRHMHLCGAKDTGSGYGRGRGHGTPFDGPGDPDLLKLIRLSERYLVKPDIVLEVREDDYFNCEGYSTARRNVLACAGNNL